MDQRQTPPETTAQPPVGLSGDETQALVDALAAVLRPLAVLAVARGLPFASAEELLKRAYVQAARAACSAAPGGRDVSRIATATGLNRREVTRLTRAPAPAQPPRPLAAELFARWTADPACRGADGLPRALPRTGAAPSFEALAQSITRDVHPRSLLDELQRLGLAAHDREADRVQLLRQAFVPSGDVGRMLGFLGDNVGDHLSAAVANVLADGRKHFEQAIFADELSAQSVEQVHQLIGERWRTLSTALVPVLETLIAEDRATQRLRDRRLRIGLYSYTDQMPAPAPPADDTPA
jgi:hypothetical protein